MGQIKGKEMVKHQSYHDNYNVRKRRSYGLGELIHCYQDIEWLHNQFKDMPWLTRRYTNKVFQITASQTKYDYKVIPPLELELKNNAYEEGLVFNTLTLADKIRRYRLLDK